MNLEVKLCPSKNESLRLTSQATSLKKQILVSAMEDILTRLPSNHPMHLITSHETILENTIRMHLFEE